MRRQRRVDIHGLDQAIGHTRYRAGRTHDQRDAVGQFERRVFHPQAMFAQALAVVAPAHDDGVLSKANLDVMNNNLRERRRPVHTEDPMAPFGHLAWTGTATIVLWTEWQRRDRCDRRPSFRCP